MGLKTSIRVGGSLFFVILLLITQIFSIVIASTDNNSQNTSSFQEHPINPIAPYEPNDVYYDCIDLLVVDDLVIAENGRVTEFLDISTPSIPNLLGISFEVEHRSSAYTNYGNTILFSFDDDYYSNHSIMKIDLTINPTNYSEIDLWDNWPFQLSLTNDTLYCFTSGNHGYTEFRIYNATNINALTLLGNSTLLGFGYKSNFFIHENFVYFVSGAENLTVYQINSSYQLSFIEKYSFVQLQSVYFHENYLFVCDNFGLQVFDYSTPSNLAYITHYNISSAQTIRIVNDVGYLTTSHSFTTLDLSNIMDIKILSQYFPGEREDVELWKLELSGNLAIILTQQMKYFDYSNRYGGYLYIFDVSSPTEIIRLYPGRIPLRDPFDILIIQIILLFVVLPIVIILITILIVLKRARKKKQQKMMD